MKKLKKKKLQPKVFWSVKSDFPCLSHAFCKCYLDRTVGQREENHDKNHQKQTPPLLVGARKAVPEGAPVPGEGAWSSRAGAPSRERSLHLPRSPPALHPCFLSAQLRIHHLPSHKGFFSLRSPGSMLALGCLTWHHDLLYFIFFIFLPENSKALLQCGLQGGKAKLRSAGRANQGPFQKFGAVCERLGKERQGQSRHSRLHSYKQGDNRKKNRRVLCFESARQCL